MVEALTEKSPLFSVSFLFHQDTKCSKQIQQYLLKNMAGENQAKLKRYFEDASKVSFFLARPPLG